MASSALTKPKSVYDHVEPDEWTTCTKRFDLACCDCSLVHEVEWRLIEINGKAKLQLKFRRNGPSTGGLRKAQRARRKAK